MTEEDNIKDWIGLKFGESVRAVEDQQCVLIRHLWGPDHQGLGTEVRCDYMMH